MTRYNFPLAFYSLPPILAYIFSDFLLIDHHIPSNFQVFFLLFLLCFLYKISSFPMASRTRSQTADSTPTFNEQNLLKEPKKEVYSFDNADIAALKASGAFPARAIIRPFDREVRSDVYSDEWVCFLSYPFSIGLRYPFPTFISRFFELTGLSNAQTMPMVWRVLVTLDQIKSRHMPDLCIEDLPIAYHLRSHGSSRFLLFSTSKVPLILKATKNEDYWRRKFFFVKRDSIDKGVNLLGKWLTSGRI
ncbi:hypothetical protein HanRHA438_Chr14g0647311 [Helianthus annuus]|uniref:Uncharacterized protein n=1 Tax=Helianthus annuus TaxID=4232 RepID=A0A9K3H6Y9_HELAN|nr:hypothetical protein HanXRQr2_Chr14g0636711 [Helianthus annuus]KAJ0485203.1 hypothetical protein HanHA89_Chr14g0565601 [Helianthus annuus]KAJ0655753.1 hypothetical protein HanLR1_Chr14g0527941 [Helianthus annuus]KAJ0659437.1 hypothetical protein HanOQP8_Chr14g0526121 [Helianthus annuus]KAJ0839764.1 hypothetical protein HanPSC8_Chr14g0610701 [Helianthus annuus]